MTESSLLISFDDQSESFVQGVEFGRLLEKMERGDDPISNNGFPVHLKDKGVIERLAKSFGYLSLFGIETECGTYVEFLGMKRNNSEN